MHRDPVIVGARRIAWISLLTALVLLPLAAAPTGADDLPESAIKSFRKAQAQYASGEKKELKKAWRRMEKLRPSCQHSIDYWQFHLTLGKAMGKADKELWGFIEKAEQANPTCPSYALLRARLERDVYKKQEHLEKAVEVAPKLMRPKMLLVDHLLANDEEIDAEEILDEILEANPDHVGSLVRKGRVQLVGGYHNAAIEFADSVLAKKQLPEMYHLKAETYLAMSEEDGKDFLEEAQKEAEAAVKLKQAPAFLVTLARVLEKRDKYDDARELVAKAYKEAPSPLLAGMLGEYAFRTGDYKQAIPAFKDSAATSPASARGLAECYLRLGKLDQAKKALAQLAGQSEDDDRRYLTYAYLGLRDFERAAKLAKGMDKEGQGWATAYAAAARGKPGELGPMAELLEKELSTKAEWVVLYFVEAQLREALGANATAGLRNRMRKAAYGAAARKLGRIEAPKEPRSLKANTLGLMRRIPNYEQGTCGYPFRTQGDPRSQMMMDTGTDAGITFYYTMTGYSGCPGDVRRAWHFNRVKLQNQEKIELLGDGDWTVVRKAWLEAAGFLKQKKWKDAVGAYDRVLKVEPYWHRVKLLRAYAEAMADPAKRPAAAKAALAAVKDWPGDGQSHLIALLVASLAGLDVDGKIAERAEWEERHSRRDLAYL